MSDETTTAPGTDSVTGLETPLASVPDPIGPSAEQPENAPRGPRETIRNEASKLTSQAADKARDFAAEGKARASGALNEFARMIVDAAGTVDDKVGQQYGQYARSAAGAVAGLAEQLDAKDLDELIEDTRAFVRKSPAVAIGAAAAIGFVLARIVKAGIDGNDDGVTTGGNGTDTTGKGSNDIA